MILISGASGRIARRTAQLLAGSGNTLRLMTRTPDRAPKLERAEIVRGDFADPSSMEAAFTGISTALIVSGSAKPGERARLHRNAFEAAARAGVDHVIYLSLQGASPHSMYPFSRDHYLSEQYLAATGLGHTVLRNAFYMDMFINQFDADGVIRGPAGQTGAAFISREDVARTAAAALVHPPSGIHDVTGPETLSVADVARRLSAIVGRPLRFQNESEQAARERLSKIQPDYWRVDLSVGWFEAIAAGELKQTSDLVFRCTGRSPLRLEDYFSLFPELLHPLRPDHV